MLAYCEVCRITYHNPSQSHKHLVAAFEIQQVRKLIGREFFAYCPFCQRTQVFQPVEAEGEASR